MDKNPEVAQRFNFIFETTSVVKYDDLEILEETKLPNGSGKVKARTMLQEADVKNSNSRIYSTPICESIVGQLSPKATGRSLLMEIDHPLFVSKDPEVLKRRAAIVEINNCGGLLSEISLDGKHVKGIFETLSGFKGPDLYNLVTKDKVDIGFSLRALGGVDTLMDGTIMVKMPIKAITYDVVSNPSHTNARVLEFLPESITEFIPESDVLYESADLATLNLDNIKVGSTQICLTEFLDDLYNRKFSDSVRKIMFRI